MSNHHRIGHLGERLAKDYLLRKGYHLLDQNWRFRKAEVDLIVHKNKVVIFVEVKTRLHNIYGYPEDSVTSKKEKLYYSASREFLHRLGHEWEIRFDIISITLEPNPEIVHFKDAFFPVW